MCLAIPGQIVEFCDPERFFARVDVVGETRTVNVALVSGAGGVEAGDWVLVHAGTAVEQVDEADAAAMRGLLDELSETSYN